jgi:tryptophan-rich sensory protein
VQSDWYVRLRKPAYQPPRQVFPVVWPILYADIAAVSASTLDRLRDDADDRALRAYQTAFAINLVLNGSWSWLFFNRHRLGLASLLSLVLAMSSTDLANRAVAARGARGWPLVLYPLWCAFATVLSAHISLLNRRRG